jgi:hypothetical protein
MTCVTTASTIIIIFAHRRSKNISFAHNYFHLGKPTSMFNITSYDNNTGSADRSRRLSPHKYAIRRGMPNEMNHHTTATINVRIINASAAAAKSRHNRDRRKVLSFLQLEDNIQLARTTYKIPNSIDQNFMDWTTELEDHDTIGLPIFWHILKSGGTTIKLMYAQCYHLVEACETGVLIDDARQQRRRQQQHQQQHDEENSRTSEQRRLIPMIWTPEGDLPNDNAPMLQLPGEEDSNKQLQTQQQRERQQELLRIVISEDGRKYVNVDVTTSEGIQRASQLGFASSQLADVIFTPLLLESAESLFVNNGNSKNNDDSATSTGTSSRKGRMFALFRHPVQRVTSIFYYLQSATWEPTYNPEYAQWTLFDYANSPYCESNWMVRSLVRKMTGPLNPEDVLIAQEILRRKCLVGLMEDMEESIRRFHSLYFRPRYFENNANEEENAAFNCAIEHFATKGLSSEGGDEWCVLPLVVILLIAYISCRVLRETTNYYFNYR